MIISKVSAAGGTTDINNNTKQWKGHMKQGGGRA